MAEEASKRKFAYPLATRRKKTLPGWIWFDQGLYEYGRQHVPGWEVGEAFHKLPFYFDKRYRRRRLIKQSRIGPRLLKKRKRLATKDRQIYQAASNMLDAAYQALVEFCLSADSGTVVFVDPDGKKLAPQKSDLPWLLLKQRITIRCTSHCKNPEDGAIVGVLLDSNAFSRFLANPEGFMITKTARSDYLIAKGLEAIIPLMTAEFGEKHWLSRPLIKDLIESWQSVETREQSLKQRFAFHPLAYENFFGSDQAERLNRYKIRGNRSKPLREFQAKHLEDLSEAFCSAIEKDEENWALTKRKSKASN